VPSCALTSAMSSRPCSSTRARLGEAVAVREAASLACARFPFPPFLCPHRVPQTISYHRSVAGACSLHGMAWQNMTWYGISRMSSPGSQAAMKHTHTTTHSSLTHTWTSPSPLFPASSEIRFVSFDRPCLGPPKRTVAMLCSSAIGARERAGDSASTRRRGGGGRSRRPEEREDEDDDEDKERRQERAAGF
jgi:hypothetical protein